MPSKSHLVSSSASNAGDAEAIRHFKESLASGQHWYVALLGSIGLWSSGTEQTTERTFNYLIDGEAFDWLLLAERLCATADPMLPENEKHALLFQGIPPITLSAAEVKKLIGEKKYTQYLNYFYGVTVEEALILAVHEEIDKERHVSGLHKWAEVTDELYLRVYDATKEKLLKEFRDQKGYADLKSTSITELKEFTYWLFKYRVKRHEKARIASDTKKALDYLKQNWKKKGTNQVLASDLNPSFPEY
jgi:hypothetical protein